MSSFINTRESTNDKVISLIAAMLIIIPAIGSTNEYLLQDTLKSSVASIFTLTALAIFFIKTKKVAAPKILALPLLLVIHSFLSIFFAHSYLASVEMIRWIIFICIAFLVANCMTQVNEKKMVWGVHIGGVIAAFWGALQYWHDFSFFAQGPQPASTFVNKNFLAEFLICSIPMTGAIIRYKSQKLVSYSAAIALAFQASVILMTGCRSAILVLIVSIPFLLFYALQKTTTREKILIITIFFTAFFLLQSTPQKFTKNTHPSSVERVASLLSKDEYQKGSSSVRLKLWKTSINMFKNNFITGVGAGGWEVHAPRYQDDNNMLELDYYAHNEFLQILGEYGTIGMLFIVGFIAYFIKSKKDQKRHLDPFLYIAILSLAGVSLTGFPWHLAGTLCLFAVYTGMQFSSHAPSLPLPSATRKLCTSLCIFSIFVCIYISYKAFECERKLITAIKISYTILSSTEPQSEIWDTAKMKVVKLSYEAIDINPHYRKLTPIIAESLLKWGDAKNSIAVFESIHQSRPYIGAIILNLSKLYWYVGDIEKSQEFSQKLKKLNTLQK